MGKRPNRTNEDWVLKVVKRDDKVMSYDTALYRLEVNAESGKISDEACMRYRFLLHDMKSTFDPDNNKEHYSYQDMLCDLYHELYMDVVKEDYGDTINITQEDIVSAKRDALDRYIALMTIRDGDRKYTLTDAIGTDVVTKLCKDVYGKIDFESMPSNVVEYMNGYDNNQPDIVNEK